MSYFLSTSFTTDPPFAPQNLKLVDYNVDFITLSWEAPENDGGSAITRYIVEKRDSQMSMWMQAGVVEKDVFLFKVDKLFEGQSYLFRVAAENECGRGPVCRNPQAYYR